MIKTSGYRVSPTEVEEVALSSGHVDEAVAVGVPDEALGQAITLAVTVTDSGQDAADAVIEHCRRTLPALYGAAERRGVAGAAAKPQRQNRSFPYCVGATGRAPGGRMMANSPGKPHPIGQFDTEDGFLVIGGVRLDRLAARVGRTPFYAYDRAHISRRIRQLKRSLPKNIHLHYAVKANPMPAVVGHIAPQVDGLDVASGRR